MGGWLRRGWRNAAGKPVANRDLWEPLIELALESGPCRSTFRWVKGHSGDRWNDFVDELAVAAAARRRGSGYADRRAEWWPPGAGPYHPTHGTDQQLCHRHRWGLGTRGRHGPGPRRATGRVWSSSTATRTGPSRSPARSAATSWPATSPTPDDCQKAVDLAAEGGTLRVAVNCAGTGWVGRVINRDGTPHDPAAFEFILRLNVIGTFNVMTRAASAIAEDRAGRGRRARA